MQQQSWLALALAEDRRQREVEQIARERRVGRSSSSVRRALGRWIIEIGARVAAEPRPELARSR